MKTEIDYDILCDIENNLMERLGNIADVDGHDYGAGEMNIFIITSDPVEAFEQVKPVIISNNLFPVLKAAYRKNEEDEFQILWPATLKEFRVT